jgi:AraC family transcriptional regulator of adaptative response / DNA-3-methyladenine glycosylase II
VAWQGDVVLSAEECYRAVKSHDARFDGMFFTAVNTTGIYCRPSCPARTPFRRNVRFYPTAAAAQSAGFRACKRCRPGASPGSPEWNYRADIAGRAVRLIGDGVVDREGVGGLARRLGYSERQVHRQLHFELGAGPIALARAQRCETARILIETTDLPMGQFAAGFSPIRQFNGTIQATFARTPGELRDRSRRQRDSACGPGAIALRLAYRPPLDLDDLFGLLAERAVPGLEEVADATYRRVLRLPHGLGVVALSRAGIARGEPFVKAELRLDDLRDLTTAVARCRRLLDLDADPLAIADALRNDPLLGNLVEAQPGRRIPGHVDAEELAIRAVLGQQVSVAAARRHTADLVAQYGEPLLAPFGSLTHAFPSSHQLAGLDTLALGMPRSRRDTVLALAHALSEDRIDLSPGTDRAKAAAALERVPGIGPWTSAYVALRGLSDPDAFLASDLGVRRALVGLGVAGDPKSALARAEAWRPWRSYGLLHLWHAQSHSPTSSRGRETG